jgi:hypothetical protein
MLFSTFAGVVTWSQGTITLRRGQTIDEEHPFARERRDLFTDEDPGAEIRSTPATRVQTAMQKPGEKRVEKR